MRGQTPEESESTAHEVVVGGRPPPPLIPLAPHPQAIEVHRKLDYLLAYQTTTGDALGLRLQGETETCKTSTIFDWMLRHPPSVTAKGLYVPAGYCRIPPKATLGAVYTAMLRGYGDGNADKGTVLNKFERLGAARKDTKTRIWFLDEIHHLFRGRSDGVKREVTQMGKALVDDGIIVVFSGTGNLDELFKEDAEFARRFRPMVAMEGYPFWKPEGMKVLTEFVDTYQRGLPLPCEVNLSDERVFVPLVLGSVGKVGTIAATGKAALVKAVQRRAETISHSDLAEGWDEVFSTAVAEGRAHAGTRNPFLLPPAEAKSRLQGLVIRMLEVTAHSKAKA